MDYSKSKIYKLFSNDGFYYYGSTVNELHKRLYSHKGMAKRRSSIKVYKHFIDVGWDNITIILVEDYPCKSKQELLRKENEYIVKSLQDPLCLNSRPSLLTEEERKLKGNLACKKYAEENRDKVRMMNKIYKQNRPKLTEEEIQKRRDYHREYQRKLRASLPKKVKPDIPVEEINRRKNRRLELQRIRRAKMKAEIIV